MDERAYNYFKQIGIDFNEDTHPFTYEYHNVLKLNNPFIEKCFDHLILKLILDLKTIEEYNAEDYKYHLSRMAKKDISFWGERFEVYWYSSLINSIKTPISNLRRGNPETEPDFIFEFEGTPLGLETTSLTYSEKSGKSDPIGKLKTRISKKEKRPYANVNCGLIIDISNLSFYRKLLNNFRTSLSDMIPSLNSNFGVILFSESYHLNDKDNNPRYITHAWDWMNPNVNLELEKFINLNARESDNSSGDKIAFKIG